MREGGSYGLRRPVCVGSDYPRLVVLTVYPRFVVVTVLQLRFETFGDPIFFHETIWFLDRNLGRRPQNLIKPTFLDRNLGRP